MLQKLMNIILKKKTIITNFLKSIDAKLNFENIMNRAETNEENSNQILKYTQEIKKRFGI